MTEDNYITDDPPTRVKHCTDCGKTKEIGEFRFLRDRRNAGYHMSRCRLCDNECKRQYQAKKREERDFMRLVAAVGQPPCETCLEKFGCKVECEQFKKYADGISG